MIKVESVKNVGTKEEKDVLWTYEYYSAQEHTVSNKYCLSYRSVCDRGEMVVFYEKEDVCERTYMLHVNKTNNYYYTKDLDKAIKVYLALLNKSFVSFYK